MKRLFALEFRRPFPFINSLMRHSSLWSVFIFAQYVSKMSVFRTVSIFILYCSLIPFREESLITFTLLMVENT